MNNPKHTKMGITFWPIPDVSDVEIAFGANKRWYFPRQQLPEVPQRYTDTVRRLFFKGGKLPDLPAQVDQKQAARFFRALLGSWEPSHEQKEATAAYALWVWDTLETAQ